MRYPVCGLAGEIAAGHVVGPVGTALNVAQQALHWYTLSARRSYSKAQLSVAAMYEHGRGVQQDRVTAYAWTLLAEQNGNPEATAGLEKLRSR